MARTETVLAEQVIRIGNLAVSIRHPHPLHRRT
jgi:hypothetical protein